MLVTPELAIYKNMTSIRASYIYKHMQYASHIRASYIQEHDQHQSQLNTSHTMYLSIIGCLQAHNNQNITYLVAVVDSTHVGSATVSLHQENTTKDQLWLPLD